MNIPDISRLSIDPGVSPPTGSTSTVQVPEDIRHATDKYLLKLKDYAQALPYSVESNSYMQQMLDFIMLRIAQCVEAKDYDPGLVQWDSMLTYWLMLKYPIPKEKRVQLARVYFHVATTPGMPTHIVANCADAISTLTRSKHKLSVEDMRLPWQPIFKILSKDLFLTRRQFEISQTSWYMGYLASICRRFFHPAATEDMLSTFLPLMNGTSLDSVLSSQYYLLTFLPQSHPQSYLPSLFQIWQSINSYNYDERMLQFLAQLSEMHVDPTVSDPKRIEEIPDDAKSPDEERPDWNKDDLKHDSRMRWSGVYKDVGIYTEQEWSHIMCKCLASMEISLKDSGSLTTGPSADGQAGFEIGRLPKPSWRIASLARIIVYSMAPDGVPAPPSSAPTPFTPFSPGMMTPRSGVVTPFGSGMMTPTTPGVNGGSLGDYLSANLSRKGVSRVKTYLAGSKALDSLVRLIASTESFFHPSTSGSWTHDLSAFIKYIVYDFNKRWHEEQQPDCRTPKHRRLTRDMKRELVKSLRTVALLAMFSQDSTTVSNIQSCLKSMSVMEPDLILYPVLERAFPALEALVETQRTLAVIKALGAIAPSLVCRDVFYPGAKHLIPILQLLVPGIDLNDPSKTLCTTSFLVEISQYILIGELGTESPEPETTQDAQLSEAPEDKKRPNGLPSFKLDGFGSSSSEEALELEPRLPDEEEDILLRESTSSFASWVHAFVRRVLVLLENLPEEGASGSSGTTETQVVDAVTGALSQICVHLSEPLYDLVLNIVFDFASNNVRSNAVRAIHQLVECVANANPEKTLAKFFPFAEQNIIIELEHGASSLRTTVDSTPLPSDTTLHWNLAILRGAMYNDGRVVLKYSEKLVALLKLLHEKTFSKRGWTWTGRLLSSTLLTLTHTYPTENRFVNPEEWDSAEFQKNHHRYWGKLYKAEDVKISWHVPSAEEIDLALRIFREVVEPAMDSLDGLLQHGPVRDAVWRNDFCRHLNLVRDAFSGIPTLAKETRTKEEIAASVAESDILNEIPEMIATIEPLLAGFPLVDPEDPRYVYITSLKRRFGNFLHTASVSLRQQGEYNTVDAVTILVRSIRTYMLEYGDSRDSYYLQREQFSSEKSVTRQYAGQKVWPRAVFVRRARLYHSARLRWNSLERRRGQTENHLIGDLLEWAMWHYASVREISQSVLESLCSVYDGVRNRCLPVLYKALEPGTEDDRMKGALWTLNSPVFAKYAMSEPTLTRELLDKMFACQHNEKPSIQSCVSTLSDNCLGSFVEPNHVVYNVENTDLDAALRDLRSVTQFSNEGNDLVLRCAEQRTKRTSLIDDASDATTSLIIDIANSSKTHWRYSIVAVRILRSLIRKDRPTKAAHIRCLLEKTYDSHPSLRYYAQRAIMKCSRYIKLRTLSQTQVDLALEQNHNPLRLKVPVGEPGNETTIRFLSDFKSELNLCQARRNPLLCEKPTSGWIAWAKHQDKFLLPSATEWPFPAWDPSSSECMSVIEEFANSAAFWKEITKHFSAETHAEAISQDHASSVKSILQLLGPKPLVHMKPILEELLGNSDKNKQRGAAELLAGLIGGSKHWPTSSQDDLWDWFIPQLRTVFKGIKTDTLLVWTSFLEASSFYVLSNKDPRRVQPLVDYLVEEFTTTDYNAESSFDAVKILCFFRAFYEELNWKAFAWMDDVMGRIWPELPGEHDDVRAYISEILVFSDKVKWLPRASADAHTAEAFVVECRQSTEDDDIMGILHGYHEGRVHELVDRFEKWRGERLPGVRAFQSTYDKVGIAVCKWLHSTLHDTHAVLAFQYILPLMPELFRFAELHDNDELSLRADMLLVRMCGVVPPPRLIKPLLLRIFEAIQSSTSWRVRLKALPLLQVFYFRHMPLIDDLHIIEILEVICKCLDDEIIEVRTMAATTLAGILRLSPRRSVLVLKDRFVRLVKNIKLPGKKEAGYSNAVRKLHAGVLGICALVDSYPYTVERWMPPLLTTVLAELTYFPPPISTTVRKCASNFKKTHQDTWHEDSKRFDEDQLAALSTLLTGSSYYA
ncbi:hypothetical protein PUNSTDRAFT_94808 [Punctularia strigosozonata HHB-11173 SS5]|uniref:uncharacterized protein n=1 Tax=Punctularia strigosozonata (strain HHB-11173) TaxID=741275 RepID=UPI00044178F0|nr:uncharacterized protein PUNSTDRAFT_94808 [Punctularia strigosozonata HHB-11173 SS5]EIN13624.1 hypothetical protein PUNSTDRAFT_94808 [Punctularia strigosozonata HHB-11173 SS5]